MEKIGKNDKILVVYAGVRERAVKAVDKLREILDRHGINTTIANLLEYENKHNPLEYKVVFILGGDGTLLRVVKKIDSPDIGIVGINFGRSGFLCQVEPDEMEYAVEKVLSGEFSSEHVLRLSAYSHGKLIGTALNEILISTRTPGRVIEYVVIQEEELLHDVADALIVATPIGSTAYSMSAGGPAVDEKVEAIILSPLASLMNIRPIVIPADIPIEIKILKGEAKAVIDGHTTVNIQDNSILIKKSDIPVNFIRISKERPFARRLRKRLSYGR